jgi:exosortase
MSKPQYPSQLKMTRDRKFRIPLWAGAAALLSAAVAWAYWPVIVRLAGDLSHDDNYSIGQLVPPVAIYLTWRKRAVLRQCDLAPCWWGIGAMLAALAVRLYGLLFLFESAERYSLILMIAAVSLLVAGRQATRRLAWVFVFLFLMVPLPGRLHNMISSPLQAQATTGAAFLLDLIGATVVRAGNVLSVNGTDVAVAEACSGLHMLTAFVVVAATLAFLIKRPPWQKAVVVASSVPIAIACNLVRLVVTAELFSLVSSQAAETFFHDFAGLAMMPLAVGILGGELWLMNRLVIPDPAPASARA